MTLQEIINIEIPAMVQTINEYTMEHYIRHYTTLLMDYRNQKDMTQMIDVVDRLIEWYDDNMNEIQHNKYIYNKHEHKKSYHLLRELQNLLNQG